ncbi:hypothetical protein Tco_0937545 [Tanacetum coccineum]|uniref:Transposase n=1 Tax=Tanacetum coccineum TaxID=301880 RepID=A0ABQ5DEK3_9ASTR
MRSQSRSVLSTEEKVTICLGGQAKPTMPCNRWGQANPRDSTRHQRVSTQKEILLAYLRTMDPNSKIHACKQEEGVYYRTVSNETTEQLTRPRQAMTQNLFVSALCFFTKKDDEAIRAERRSIKNLKEQIAKAAKGIRTYEYGTLITSDWIARNYAKKIMINPNIKIKESVELILKKYKCKVTLSQARRGKKKALNQYQTCLEDHYGMLWSYASEILNSNPWSTCKLGVDNMPDGKNYFKTFYVCFKGVKQGWLQGCRRVIGLTVILDHHKGLIEAAKEIIPLAKHRQLARHISKRSSMMRVGGVRTRGGGSQGSTSYRGWVRTRGGSSQGSAQGSAHSSASNMQGIRVVAWPYDGSPTDLLGADEIPLTGLTLEDAMLVE